MHGKTPFLRLDKSAMFPAILTQCPFTTKLSHPSFTMNSLLYAWTSAIQSVSWHSCNVQSHALTLFLIYFVYHYPWGWQNRDKLLQPPRKGSRSNKSSRKRTYVGSSSSVETSDTSHSSLDESLEADEALAKLCPAATAAERKRFLNARQGSVPGAEKILKNYLSWHQKHMDVAVEHRIVRQETNDKDLDIWREACLVAMKACQEKGDGILPRVIRTHIRTDGTGDPLVDKDGFRIFQIMPAQMDINLASSSTYALAVALYLNLQLDREAEERIVVCMDVRAGQGWPNTHAVRLVPFMQQTTTLLLSLFPERLHRCLLYPVPPSFMWVWNAISKVVDPLTREKICLMSGPNKIVSPPPFEQMFEHMDMDAAHHLEGARVGDFR